MQKIHNQKHDKHTYNYAGSRLLERIAFYGIRSILVLYMVKAGLQIPEVKAISIYAFFTSLLIIGEILGAILGDLFLGNKKAIIVGGIVQACGAFMLCIPSMIGLYLGLGLIWLGTGLFNPNHDAYYGKLYYSKPKIMDSGFMILYLAINIGSLLGTVLINFIGESFGWSAGFILAGIFSILAIIRPYFSTNNLIEKKQETQKIVNPRYIVIIITVLAFGLFWGLSEIYSIGLFNIQTNIWYNVDLTIPKDIFSNLSPFSSFPLSFILIIWWARRFSNSFFRLIIGFFMGAISFGILLFIPEIPDTNSILIFIVSGFFMGIAELHLKPVVNSIITQYANPKYLAIWMSLSILPTSLFVMGAGTFYEELQSNMTLGIIIGMAGMGIIGLGLFIYSKKFKST